MITKKCNKCKTDKALNEFHKQSCAPDGLRYVCKSCRSMLAAEYNRKTSTRRHRLSREWYYRNRGKVLARQKKNAPKCARRRSELNKKRWDELKEKVYSHYGKLCACCGETEMSFLTIDHINDDGAIHRQGAGKDLYRWLIKNSYPEQFQTLCRNCNFGKYINDGTCPHKKERK